MQKMAWKTRAKIQKTTRKRLRKVFSHSALKFRASTFQEQIATQNLHFAFYTAMICRVATLTMVLMKKHLKELVCQIHEFRTKFLESSFLPEDPEGEKSVQNYEAFQKQTTIRDS